MLAISCEDEELTPEREQRELVLFAEPRGGTEERSRSKDSLLAMPCEDEELTPERGPSSLLEWQSEQEENEVNAKLTPAQPIL